MKRGVKYEKQAHLLRIKSKSLLNKSLLLFYLLIPMDFNGSNDMKILQREREKKKQICVNEKRKTAIEK